MRWIGPRGDFAARIVAAGIDRAKTELGIKRVHFHGIFNDELGVKTKTWLSRSGKTNFRDDAEVNLGTYQELGVRDFLISEGSMGWP